METVAIELMQDFSEIVHYEHTGIPLYIRTADLAVYPGMSAPCHWHDDIEWIYIISGKMCYYINGKRILLDEKDSLMVNARQMHYGYSYKEQDCHFLCILFHPSLFGSNKTLLQKYVTPVIENADCEYLHFHSKQARGKEIAEYLEQIRCLKAESANAYEMQVVAVMLQLWGSLLQSRELVISPFSAEKWQRQKYYSSLGNLNSQNRVKYSLVSLSECGIISTAQTNRQIKSSCR